MRFIGVYIIEVATECNKTRGQSGFQSYPCVCPWVNAKEIRKVRGGENESELCGDNLMSRISLNVVNG